jgi:hypothetical protein
MPSKPRHDNKAMSDKIALATNTSINVKPAEAFINNAP